MKLWIDEGEHFPFYTFETREPRHRYYTEIEVDEETFKRWEAVYSDFKQVEREIDNLVNAAHQKRIEAQP